MIHNFKIYFYRDKSRELERWLNKTWVSLKMKNNKKVGIKKLNRMIKKWKNENLMEDN